VVTQTLADVDVVVHVVEAGKWGEGDDQILPLLRKARHTILAINKVDLLKNKADLLPYIAEVSTKHAYDAVVPVSGERLVQLDTLLSEVARFLPECEPMFEEDILTDLSMHFIAAEIIREK